MKRNGGAFGLAAPEKKKWKLENQIRGTLLWAVALGRAEARVNSEKQFLEIRVGANWWGARAGVQTLSSRWSIRSVGVSLLPGTSCNADLDQSSDGGVQVRKIRGLVIELTAFFANVS